MSDIFSGLECFGIKNVDHIDIFEEEVKEDKKVPMQEVEPKVVSEEDFLFEKTYTCPVCEHKFKSKMVRTGKAKLLGADTDLRPKYQGVDSLKYDAVMCPKCGYAALNRYFNFVMAAQAKAIREQISANFKDEQKEDKIYDYDTALARHKLALLNTVVKKGKASEKAYTCLKIAWLYRGKREKMKAEGKDRHKQEELFKEEMQSLMTAYEGFQSAFSKEDFPMCGMDQNTLSYLLADLARRVGKVEDAKRWVSKVLVARNANKRIKDKALDLKELLQKTSE